MTQHLNVVTSAVQGTAFWQTQVPPGDFASGIASTSWTPVATAITTGLAIAKDQDARRSVYMQAYYMVQQMQDQATTNPALSPTQRTNALAYCAQLLGAYERFVRPNTTV